LLEENVLEKKKLDLIRNRGNHEENLRILARREGEFHVVRASPHLLFFRKK
jgi:hypothetical protein